MATMATTAIEGDLKASRVDTFDLTRADIWAEDRWQSDAMSHMGPTNSWRT